MLRIPRKVLSEGICTERSLIRIERTNYNPSMYVLTNLFERMGLCGEYRRGQLVTTDIHLLNIYKRLVDGVNNYNNEESAVCLEELQSDLSMLISHNRQEINRILNIYENRIEKLPEEVFYSQGVDALECTLPIWAIYPSANEETQYFTRAELCCICDLAFSVEGAESSRCRDIIKEICQRELQGEIHPMHLGIVEFLANALSRWYIEKQEVEEAKKIQNTLIKSCLFHKRMPYTFTNPNQINAMWIE